MTFLARATRGFAAFVCSLLLWSGNALAATTDLSSGIVLYPPGDAPWAVYAYDPHTSRWTKLDKVTWTQVSSLGHSGYLVEATAPGPTAASTFRVVMDVIGKSVEIFMTPAVTQTLAAGQTTTLRINLF
jgi:hypothetical protein